MMPSPAKASCSAGKGYRKVWGFAKVSFKPCAAGLMMTMAGVGLELFLLDKMAAFKFITTFFSC